MDAAELQWGRPFYGAERETIAQVHLAETVLLQWGRPFYGAERQHKVIVFAK